MKIHPILIEAVADTLTEIFVNKKYADKTVEKVLRSNPKWGSRDRAFIAETTYECVRWWRLLNILRGNQAISRWAEGQAALAFSKTDILAAVGVYLVMKNGQNIDNPYFKDIDFDDINTEKTKITNRADTESIPEWLDECAKAELGEAVWTAEMHALNQPTKVVLRTNTLKISPAELQKALAAADWETESTPLSTEALVLKKRGNIFNNTLFKEGFFEVQDAGSQLIAPFLDVEPSMRVIDACAGAGGKSLHLAALMQNKGKIISMDIEAWKLDELRRRARRNSVNIIETRPIESTKTIKRLAESADRVLLDVPCSGLGVLRRNPDAKWKLSPQAIEHVRITQQEILKSYARMTRIGGKLVYATCSILPSENEKQVERFLAENKNFRFEKDQKITPAQHGFDGFYMALLERIG